MHCTKVSFVEDKQNCVLISAESDSKHCVAYGRLCQYFSDDVWKPLTLEIATAVICHEFKSDLLLARLLVSTGNAQIVNVNNILVWGIGPDLDGSNFTVTEADLMGL